VLVVAVAENGVIGAHGTLPWRMKADLQRFRRVTMGKPVIMGRATFDTIGRALDGRDNIVLTRRHDFAAEGVLVAHDLAQAFRLAQAAAARSGAGEICVIGGGAVFLEALPQADRVDLTEVAAAPEGDVFFPRLDPQEWAEVAREHLPPSPGDTVTAVSAVYHRRKRGAV